VQALDEIYGTKRGSKAMKPELKLTALAMDGDPQRPEKEPLEIKCFYESDKQDESAEFFTNIDLKARRLELNEKDEEYRAAMVKAFAAMP